jgi:hypothetical protein
MKDKIVGFFTNVLYELVLSMIFLGFAFINALAVNATQYSDLAGWAKVCVDISMGFFGLIIIEQWIVPGVYALLKLLKIVK